MRREREQQSHSFIVQYEDLIRRKSEPDGVTFLTFKKKSWTGEINSGNHASLDLPDGLKLQGEVTEVKTESGGTVITVKGNIIKKK